jgi:hemoglobin-like flavoprotein
MAEFHLHSPGFSPPALLMNLDTIALVQDSMEKVMQDADTAVTLFYNRLFRLDPALQPLFPPDLNVHGRRFLATLNLGICGLDAPETIIPAIKEVGRIHAGYGVQPQHYHTMGRALLWTLAQMQGDTFTPALGEAWTEAYYLLAGLMKEAAAG